MADISAVENHRVVESVPVLAVVGAHEVFFYFLGGVAVGESQSSSHSVDVSIYGHSRDIVGDREHYGGGFSADSGKSGQFFYRPRDLAVIFSRDNLGGLDDIFPFIIKKSA